MQGMSKSFRFKSEGSTRCHPRRPLNKIAQISFFPDDLHLHSTTLKIKITKPKAPNPKRPQPTRPDIRPLQDIDPALARFVKHEVLKIRQADTRRKLAVVKLMEFVVSGKVPKPVEEDDTVTVCRLISNGVRDLDVSESTKRKISIALAPFNEASRWKAKTKDVVAMREWRGSRAATRAILLIVLLGKACGHAQMETWLENPNPKLNGNAPVDFVRAQKWTELADHLDAVLLAH
jgi:hypothetical protein